MPFYFGTFPSVNLPTPPDGGGGGSNTSLPSSKKNPVPFKTEAPVSLLLSGFSEVPQFLISHSSWKSGHVSFRDVQTHGRRHMDPVWDQ